MPNASCFVRLPACYRNTTENNNLKTSITNFELKNCALLKISCIVIVFSVDYVFLTVCVFCSLCVLADSSAPETEDCFDDLLLADDSPSFVVTRDDFTITNQVQLPQGVTCAHCVLRWTYRCGTYVLYIA